MSGFASATNSADMFCIPFSPSTGILPPAQLTICAALLFVEIASHLLDQTFCLFHVFGFGKGLHGNQEFFHLQHDVLGPHIVVVNDESRLRGNNSLRAQRTVVAYRWEVFNL